ncbi:MAG: hypothetical protein GY757_11330 [bacterium]|nr:hypothetical protein [bacterium]
MYFDVETRQRILNQFHHLLNPGGFLILGASENILGSTDQFELQHMGQTVLYKKEKLKSNYERTG